MIETSTTSARLVPRGELADDDIERMFDLLSAHFEGVTAEHFRRDLERKNFAVLIERDDQLVGFTTILAYETAFDGQALSVVYSGDTIVAPTAWNTPTLPRAWIESVVALRQQYPRGRYVWLLITSGFRTYRLLPLFWREFFPRHDSPTPPKWRRMIEHIALERFGSQYDSAKGVVRLEHPQRLRQELAGIPDQRMDDPHVRFFAARNPHHARGDELVCMTELTPANLTAAGRRMARACPQW
jgi:hypothetical protein